MKNIKLGIPDGGYDIASHVYYLMYVFQKLFFFFCDITVNHLCDKDIFVGGPPVIVVQAP